jgi:hypothetical protein
LPPYRLSSKPEPLSSWRTLRSGTSWAVLHRSVKKPKVWKAWHDHMNVHLMHLSYGRLSSKTQWNGQTVNADLLDEFQKAWKLFLAKVERLAAVLSQ